MMSTRQKLACGLLGTVMTFGTANAETIYACAKKNNGQLRVVEAPGQCLKSEYEVSWDDSQGQSGQINELLGRVSAIEAALGMINEAPIVDAGANFAIMVTMNPEMLASASDDGLLLPLSYYWEVVSGPGTVTFSDAESLLPQVSFSETGTYELQLSVDDGVVVVSDRIEIVVHPFNTPPQLSANTPQIVAASLTDSLYGSVIQCDSVIPEVVATDDGLPFPLQHEWTIDQVGVYPPDYIGWHQVTVEFTSEPVGSPIWPLTFRAVESNLYKPTAYAVTADLTLTVSDGYHTESIGHQVSCDIRASEVPVVDAGPDVSAIGENAPDGYECLGLAFFGSATDDGLPSPLELTWSAFDVTPTPTSGWRPYFEFVPRDAATTTLNIRIVDLYGGATYLPPSVSATIRLIANDGSFKIGYDDASVTCTRPN